MALVVKNLPANAGDTRNEGSIPGLGRSPGAGKGKPLLPRKLHGQRNLVSYSPWSHKESDTTVQRTRMVFQSLSPWEASGTVAALSSANLHGLKQGPLPQLSHLFD